MKTNKDWSVIQRHFEMLFSRYPSITDWDVVNEPVDERKRDGYRRNSFYEAFGPVYVEAALRIAHHLHPTGKLAINEYGLSYDTPYHAARRKAFLRLLQGLLDRNTPLHSVGLQTHLDLSAGRLNQRIIARFLEAIASMGLEIVITELDVKEADRSAPVAVRDARVAREVSEFLAAALSVPAVKGVITWGLSDRHSWLQDELPLGRSAPSAELNRGLPFDGDYRPKPMLEAIQHAFASA